MRRRLVGAVLAIGALTALVPPIAQAGSGGGSTAAITVPPICIVQPLPGGLNLQIGYCP